MDDFEFDPQEQAIRDVTRKLVTTEHLMKVKELKADYTRKKQTVETQLSHIIRKQAHDTRNGLAILQGSCDRIHDIRANFAKIDRLARRCQLLIQHYPIVKTINTVRSNIQLTRHELQFFFEIPQKIAEVETLLQDDSKILEAHAKLWELEKRRDAQLLVRENPEEMAVLQGHYIEVDRLVPLLANKLWQAIRNVLSLSQQPDMRSYIVKVLQVIEKEERRDQKRVDRAANDPSPRVQPKGYLGEAISVLHSVIDERFQLIVGECGEDVEAIIAASEELLDDLTVVIDYVVPLFPPRYDVFNTFVKGYHKHFVMLFETILNEGKMLSKDILMFVQWSSEYHAQLDGLGAEDVAPVLPDALPAIFEIYNSQILAKMREWSSNIVTQDQNHPPEAGPHGYPVTHGPVDLFKMLNQQIELASEASCGEFLFRVVESCKTLLFGYQYEITHLVKSSWKDMDTDFLCALENNNQTCLDCLSEMSERLEGLLEDGYFERIDLEKATDGFLALAQLIRRALADVIFLDLSDSLSDIFRKKWHSGEPVLKTILATFHDFFSEFQESIQDYFFKKLVVECLGMFIVKYLQALLMGKDSDRVDEKIIEQIRNEMDDTATLFKQYAREKLVDAEMTVMGLVLDFLTADDGDGLCLVCLQFLEQHSDCPFAVAEKLLQLRSNDFSKEERIEILDTLRETFENFKTVGPRTMYWTTQVGITDAVRKPTGLAGLVKNSQHMRALPKEKEKVSKAKLSTPDNKKKKPATPSTNETPSPASFHEAEPGVVIISLDSL